MTATEINEQLGLPKQTVHRLCATLEREGFLNRHGTSRSFLPSRRLRELGVGLMFSSRSHMARRQILLDVAREVRETVNFAVPKDTGMSYLDRVETDWALQMQLPIGTNVPFHCTASGKCFLASLPAREQKRFVSSLDLRPWTDATKTQSDALEADLTEIRTRGYSLDEAEFNDGMVAIAVPVTDNQGRFVAALAFHGPTQRLSIADVVEQKSFMQEAAGRLQEALFPA